MPESALELLREAGEVAPTRRRRRSRSRRSRAIAGADAVVTLLTDRVDAAFLDAAGPQLRVVANVAVGYNNIDVAAGAARGVLVTNTPGVLTDATADLAMALILDGHAPARGGRALIRVARAVGLGTCDYMLGTGLQGKTLGIVGMGRIGARHGPARARVRDGGHLQRGAAPRRSRGRAGRDVLGFDDLLGTSDVVSLHCPLTPETHHLIDARAPRADAQRRLPRQHDARPGRRRGRARRRARATASIAGAGLDVFEHEPDVHPGLLELENVVLIPHLGSATIETRTAMAVLAARNAAAVLRRRASRSRPCTL